MNIAITSLLITGIIGIILGILLALISKFFSVRSDEILEGISKLLPNVNCGACGFPGCLGYAQALIKSPELLGKCTVGGIELQKKLAEVLNLNVSLVEAKKVARILCKGDNNIVNRVGNYRGIKDCQTAVFVAGGGDKACPYGCLGYGSCVSVCQFMAIKMGENGLPIIDEKKCTGCGLCVKACPKNLISLVPSDAYFFIDCSSHDKGVRVKKYCSVGCIACNLCVKLNNNVGISLKENLPIIDYKLFKGDKTAAEKCPTKTIFFDEAKYESQLSKTNRSVA